MNSQTLVRDMTLGDVPDVYAIERECYPFPWSKTLFEDAVRSSKCCLVLSKDSNIVGYAIISYVVGEAELLNICVSPSVQGQGLSKILLQSVINHAIAADNHEMYLEVRVSNTVARQLYDQFGFNEIGRRKGYYPTQSGREDAILMALTL